ncbi:MAG TPA: ABC transporter ATP-binding protein [Acidimicrobiia bacterium]|nr:ABC transporter ATP-binding protein [Acidimicrobiia bacterium]
MSDSMIVVDHVSKIFPGTDAAAVTDLSLEVGRGEFVTLVGPSGCGKTTILKMINRIVEPTSGDIRVDGVSTGDIPAPELRRSIGYVIQQIGLFPHRTIAQNIATVPELLGWEPDRIRRRVGELVDTVGLPASMLPRYPTELSGGQQQRVGVARALAADPPVLLMDEPFGAVDPIVRTRLQDEFLALQADLQKTVVFVTHDIDEAIRMGDRIAILNIGGVLEQFDTPDKILSQPATAFVADFLGRDRGIKRLSLVRLDTFPLARGPIVDVSDTPGRAAEVMTENGLDWVTVLDDGRLLGWVWGSDLTGVARVGEVESRPFRVTVECSSNLREALDAIVNTQNNVGVVLEGERYVGMLTLDLLTAELVG